MTRVLEIPDFAVVALIGPSGAGKSTFAHKHFRSTEVLSSDHFRALVADDELDQAATSDAFDALFTLAAIRLKRRRSVVIDATNVKREDRRRIIELAREYHALPVAILLDVKPQVCIERNATRGDRNFGGHVVTHQYQAMQRDRGSLKREGFRIISSLRGVKEMDEVQIRRRPLWADKRQERGPFDLIGDVHGCFSELRSLLEKIGYGIEIESPDDRDRRRFVVSAPEGRRAVFLGDLVDRGPNSPDLLRLVMDMVEQGSALCVPGNHDFKLVRKLRGRDVKIAHGLAETLEQLEGESDAFRERVITFLDGLVSHLWLDDGKLVVAHAGLREDMQGRGSAAVRSFALYGETSGEVDEFGLPVRHDWAREYRGEATVVYGHTPTPRAEWLNRTICIDQGCVFGGQLTALRYPELQLESVDAERVWCEPVRPLVEEGAPGCAQQDDDRLLDFADVSGKRVVTTQAGRQVIIEGERAAAALEVMSRFAVDPRLLIYLPPTMSPPRTSELDGFLEHPHEAFEWFRRDGVAEVVCEEKHMGSRVVVLVARNEQALAQRFGWEDGGLGVCTTRTGREFFDDVELGQALLARVRDAAEAAGLFEELDTDWLLLDAELMPWSAKAQGLLKQQYAPVGAAGRVALRSAQDAVQRAQQRGLDIGALGAAVDDRVDRIDRYVEAYRGYCWSTASLEDLRLAPFHLLASEGRTHFDADHLQHMAWAKRLAEHGEPILFPTAFRHVVLDDEEAVQSATDWWLSRTQAGAEGMVVKPRDFIARHPKGLVQPAIKVRGKEYLRIIYGPDYDLPENLDRLRKRGLKRKQSLAMREFTLGIEGLERFVRRAPLREVHECVFGVLALESEPVDPRL